MAYYEKIEAPINETYSIALYVVYYQAMKGNGNSFQLFGIYEKEEMAIAVTNAIKEGII